MIAALLDYCERIARTRAFAKALCECDGDLVKFDEIFDQSMADSKAKLDKMSAAVPCSPEDFEKIRSGLIDSQTKTRVGEYHKGQACDICHAGFKVDHAFKQTFCIGCEYYKEGCE